MSFLASGGVCRRRHFLMTLGSMTLPPPLLQVEADSQTGELDMKKVGKKEKHLFKNAPVTDDPYVVIGGQVYRFSLSKGKFFKVNKG